MPTPTGTITHSPPPGVVESRRRVEVSRWSGLVFVALAVPAAVLGNPTNPYLDTREDYLATYADGAGSAPFGRLIGLAATLALLWAVARLRVAFPAGHAGTAGAVITLAGTVLISAWIGQIVAAGATYTAVDHSGDFGGYTVVPETAFVIDFVADGFAWAGLVAASAMVWGIVLAAKRTGALPGWMRWIGTVLVVLLPGAWMLFMLPYVVFLAWFAAVVAVAPTPR